MHFLKKGTQKRPVVSTHDFKLKLANRRHDPTEATLIAF